MFAKVMIVDPLLCIYPHVAVFVAVPPVIACLNLIPMIYGEQFNF